MPRRSMQVLLAVTLPFICSCVSVKRSPSARFFVLRAVAESSAPRSGSVTGLVGILPAELPDHLVRSQMVTWTSDNEIQLDEFTRWGEPLNVGVTRVVRENLTTLLPDFRFVDYPWKVADPIRCRVQVQIGTFGRLPDGTVRLEGSWALLTPASDEPGSGGPFLLQSEPLERRDGQTTVETMSQLLAKLCEEIAAGIRALPTGSLNAAESGG